MDWFLVVQCLPQIKLVFKDFDTRTKRAVYNDVSKNRKVVPTAPLDNDVISGKNSDLYPLAGFPNEYTLFCNEHGQYVFYDSDRYGFRNNDNLWDKKIDAVLLGDSFAHGACVDQDEGFAKNLKEATSIANEIGYPVLVRPSYVLGGRAMEIAYNEKHLAEFTKSALEVSSNNIILVDQYLENATEVDVDIIRDGKGEIFVAGLMEHIEEAGIHSGDSACSLPPFSISKEIRRRFWIKLRLGTSTIF